MAATGRADGAPTDLPPTSMWLLRSLPRALAALRRSGTVAVPGEARKPPPSCSPFSSTSELAAWAARPRADALSVVAGALDDWFLHASPSRPSWRAASSWASSWPTAPELWGQARPIQALVASAVQTLRGPPLGREALRGLEFVRELLLRWLFPAAARARLAQAAPLVCLWYFTGWVLLLGSLRADFARRPEVSNGRRAAGLPSGVVSFLRQDHAPAALASILEWFADQIAVVTGARRPAAAVYMLCGHSRTYVGLTARSHPGAGARRLGLPDHRHWQHVRDLMSRRAAGSVHKLRAFSREPVSGLATYLVRVGDVMRMSALESRLIRMLAPHGNAQGAFCRGWRRSHDAARVPRPAPSRRARPPKGSRAAPGASPVAAALSGAIGTMVRMVAAQRAAARAEAARPLMEVHFRVAYDLYRLVPGTVGVGPLDVAANDAEPLRRGVEVPWALLRRRLGLQGLYNLGRALRRVQRHGRRLLGVRRWRAYMAALGSSVGPCARWQSRTAHRALSPERYGPVWRTCSVVGWSPAGHGR